MKICIIQIGKSKKEYEVLEKEFTKRLGAFATLEFKTLPEAKTDDPDKNKEIEGEKILSSIPKDSKVIALHERGDLLDSQEFAKLIAKEKNLGLGKITLIIGGPFGLSKSVLSAVELQISLSKLTFTHQMVRMILLEQLYRAFTIITGKKYHY